MKIRRFLFVISLCTVLITLNVVPASALDGSENIIVTDLDMSASVALDTNVYEDVTDDMNSASYTSGTYAGYTCFTFPGVEYSEHHMLLLTDEFSINSGHEYHLEFDYFFNVNLWNTMQVVLVYYDSSGAVTKEQYIVDTTYIEGGKSYVRNVSVDFVPDVSDITGGYTCKLLFRMIQGGMDDYYATQRFYISTEIIFIDKDDVTDWYAKIYNAIIQHDANVDSAVSQLETKLINQIITLDNNVDAYIATLDNHIKIYLDELGSDILAAISSLDSNLAGYIKSFQDALIANDNRIFEALKEFLHNEMNPGVYEDPGEDDYQSSKDEFEQIEGELPTFDSSDMQEVDISNYSGGFGAVRYLFDRFIAVSGLETLLSFSLMFGLGVFLIGRKVGG